MKITIEVKPYNDGREWIAVTETKPSYAYIHKSRRKALKRLMIMLEEEGVFDVEAGY